MRNYLEGKDDIVTIISLSLLFLLLATFVIFLAQLFIDRETNLMQYEAERSFSSSTLMLLQEEHSGALEAMDDAGVMGIGVYSNNGRLRLGLGSVPNTIDGKKLTNLWRPDEQQYITGTATYNQETGMIEYLRYSRFSIEMETGTLMLDEQGYLPSPLTFPDVVYILFDGRAYHQRVTVVRTMGAVAVGVLFLFHLMLFRIFHNNRKYRDRLARQEQLVSLGEAARTLAHEIKNPLSAIAIQIAILKKTLPKDATEGLTVIDQESRRLKVLTDRINDFLRNPVGTPEPIEIRSLIRSLTERFETPITITSNSMKKAYVSIDPSRARSIFENVLKNAVESTDERDPEVTVEITRSKKRFLYIYIRDRGDGIDPKHLDKIYDPFFTTKVKGSGIGLSISRQFVRARGGDITLYGREGGGTVVGILLPLAHQ